MTQGFFKLDLDIFEVMFDEDIHGHASLTVISHDENEMCRRVTAKLDEQTLTQMMGYSQRELLKRLDIVMGEVEYLRQFEPKPDVTLAEVIPLHRGT